MRLNRNTIFLSAWMAAASLAPLAAQTSSIKANTQLDIASAEGALRQAEASGAPLYAKAIYDEAASKLATARMYFNGDHRNMSNEDARSRVIEAYHAARAADAIARLTTETRETISLREDIRRFGGTAPNAAPMTFGDDMIARGNRTADLVQYGRAIYDRAVAAGAKEADPEDIKMAKDRLDTAEKLTRSNSQKDLSVHLAYVGEMLARRAEAMAMRTGLTPILPGLRLERTRLAQLQSEAQAARDRAARDAAEQNAAQLRAQLSNEAATRQMQEAELQRLRSQLAENDQHLRSQIDEDRNARVRAEGQLDELRRQYQSALQSSADPVALEALRRQVEDQSLALRSMQDRERVSEQAYSAEVARLKNELDNTKSQGNMTAQALSDRQAQIAQQQEELNRLRSEREANEQKRSEMERQQLASIQAAEEKRRAAESEATELRQQLAEEHSRAEQATTELSRTKEQMRMEQMRQSLASIAKTSTDDRGLIVTLPGIFFDTGKSALKPGAKNTLTRIAAQLAKNDALRVAVEGHTDSVGSDDANMSLSEKRAAAVRDYLVSKGMAGDRITSSGKGEATPVATNKTAAGRQQNRRVELIITQ